MQRSKQTALMFLLGAVLVGGVLGFSADRVIQQEKQKHAWGSRTRMYNDLGLSDLQRATLDSLLDERNCQINAVMKPVAPQIDAIKKAAHQEILERLSPEQRGIMEVRRAEMARRDSTFRARRDSIRAATNKTQTVCNN